jgi:predicted dehydrogenase
VQRSAEILRFIYDAATPLSRIAVSSSASHRIAFIGTRGHFGTVLRELQTVEPVDVVGMSPGGDSVEAIQKWAGEHSRTIPSFDSVEPLLDETKPTICVVCGPFEAHASHTIAALERGIHVIAEKPVATTFADLDKVERVCNSDPRVQLAGMMFSRFDSGFFHAKQLIADGAIGEVRLLNARKSYKLGKRGAFYASRDSYGGTIPWVGSHAIDWALWYANATPKRVYATHSSRENGGNGSMERSATCLMEFDREVAATVSIDVFRPEAAPSHGDDWIRVVGTTGTIEVRNNRIEVVDAQGTRSITPPAPGRNFLQTFIGQIEGTVEPVIDARQTIDLTKTLLVARQSADERRLIDIV